MGRGGQPRGFFRSAVVNSDGMERATMSDARVRAVISCLQWYAAVGHQAKF